MIIGDEVPSLGSNRIHVTALCNDNTMRKVNCDYQVKIWKCLCNYITDAVSKKWDC